MKLPNAWGLYNMQGNVFEWIQDWHGENYYSIRPTIDSQEPASGLYLGNRGGCYHYYNYSCRSTCRAVEILPTSGWPRLGSRNVRPAQ